MMRGDRFAVACLVLLLLYCLLFFAIGFLFAVSETDQPTQEQEPTFAQRPHDRPVIENMPKVWESRATGISEFYFDGDHYVIENLPKEYVDYSAWYVRLP